MMWILIIVLAIVYIVCGCLGWYLTRWYFKRRFGPLETSVKRLAIFVGVCGIFGLISVLVNFLESWINDEFK